MKSPNLFHGPKEKVLKSVIAIHYLSISIAIEYITILNMCLNAHYINETIKSSVDSFKESDGESNNI